jgi:hypothetical protein
LQKTTTFKLDWNITRPTNQEEWNAIFETVNSNGSTAAYEEIDGKAASFIIGLVKKNPLQVPFTIQYTDFSITAAEWVWRQVTSDKVIADVCLFKTGSTPPPPSMSGNSENPTGGSGDNLTGGSYDVDWTANSDGITVTVEYS